MKFLMLIALLAGLALAGFMLIVGAAVFSESSKGKLALTDGAKTLRYWKKGCHTSGFAELVKESDPFQQSQRLGQGAGFENDKPRGSLQFSARSENQLVRELSMERSGSRNA